MVDRRKRETRARMRQTGEPYTVAARAVQQQQAPQVGVFSLDEVAPVRLQAPVALMLARHLMAAGRHLSSAAQLADPMRNDGAGLGTAGGPVCEATTTAQRALLALRRWAETCAAASDVIPAAALESRRDAVNPPSQTRRQAEDVLYPSLNAWCSEAPGGTLPQPGERLGEKRRPHQEADRNEVQYLLPGPVPSKRLMTSGFSGQGVVHAKDVVPGTPAEAVWAAQRELAAYSSAWMFRDGDSPADLAAALDGLIEIADGIAGLTQSLAREFDDRLRAGTITGIDPDELRQATDDARDVLNGDWDNDRPSLAGRIGAVRDAVAGARAALPDPDPSGRVPAQLARELTGRTQAEIRHEYGQERFLERAMRGSDRSTILRPLARILHWMQAHNIDRYDPTTHANNDTALQPDR
jgi:hypothetical protein